MNHYLIYEGCNGTALGALQEAYAPLFTQHINRDHEELSGLTITSPYTENRFREWVDALGKSQNTKVFAVLRKDAEGAYEYIGHTGIHGIRWPGGFGTSGSVMVAHRGEGHGTEAKLLLLYHCFGKLGLRKVTSSVKAFNAASLGHLVKCGYAVCGRRREHIFHQGKYVDQIYLEVFPKDFWPIWQRYQETGKLPKLSDEERQLVAKETHTT